MKVLNSRPKEKSVQIFTDDEGNTIGFAGFVDVYSQSIYIDTRNGKGYDKVISLLGGMITCLAKKYKLKGLSFEDRKQHVVMRVLEGIVKYNPNRDSKLSSFLQMRVSRRLVNDIRDESRIRRNPTFLNTNSYLIKCTCGNKQSLQITSLDDISQSSCENCDRELSANMHRVSVNIGTNYLEDYVDAPKKAENFKEFREFYDSIFEGITGDNNNPDANSILLKCDMDLWINKLNSEDPRLGKLVELISVHNYSVHAAAKKVGISGTWAGNKLKKLKDNDIVKEIFNRP